jgi:TRAP-type mannitol/chloroaromatic compound transport system permease small subunit
MKIFNIIDSISIWTGKIFSWTSMILAAVVLYEVTARYLFNSPTIWAFDSAMFFYSVLYLMGSAFVLWEGKHIRVDVIFMRFPKRVRAALDTIFYVVFFFPYVAVMVWWGNKDAMRAYKVEEISNTSQWGEQVFLWKFLIPLGFALMFLQGIVEFSRTLRRLRRDSDGT